GPGAAGGAGKAGVELQPQRPLRRWRQRPDPADGLHRARSRRQQLVRSGTEPGRRREVPERFTAPIPRRPEPGVGSLQRGSRRGTEVWRHPAIPGDTAICTTGTGVRGPIPSNMGELMTDASKMTFSGTDSYLRAAMSGLAARQRAIA